jgi:hypothetical protein
MGGSRSGDEPEDSEESVIASGFAEERIGSTLQS